MKAPGEMEYALKCDQTNLVFIYGKLLNPLLEEHLCAKPACISSRPHPQRKAALRAGAATLGLGRRDTAVDPVTGSIHNTEVTHSTLPTLLQLRVTAEGYSEGFVHTAQAVLLPDGLRTSMLYCTWPTSPLSPIRNLDSPEVQLFLRVWRF